MSPSITSTLASQPCITLSPITKSIRNEKYKEEEEEQLTYTTLNYNIEKKTTLTLWISSLKDPKGGIYRHKEKRGQQDKPWPKALARPCQYGHGNAAKVVFSRLYQSDAAAPLAVRCRFDSLSVVHSRILI